MSRTSHRIPWLLLLAFTRFHGQPAGPLGAPRLELTGTRIVRVATEPQLQAAMNNLHPGDTLLLADGTYRLTASLYINGRDGVTIRGDHGSTNVLLAGQGMDNANHGSVPFGIWSNSKNTTVAHLTISDTYDNEVIFNPGAQNPRVYSVRLLNAGSQFIKSNPTDVNAGLGVNGGVVEYCSFEYSGRPPADHGAGVGYFNGISAHATKNWVVRHNLFKNLHNPDGTAYPWNPAVLFWRNSSNTVTEGNTFIDVDRAVAYGLDNSTPYRDHSGGAVRNNFVYLTPGLFSTARKNSSDGSIIAWNSPGTAIDHNSVLLNQNAFYAIEFRFANTTNAAARNNLCDAPVHLRDNAKAVIGGNIANAAPGLFQNAATGDLHLLPSATEAIDKAPSPAAVTNDFDGELRPTGGRNSDIGADEITFLPRPAILELTLHRTDADLIFSSALSLNYFLEHTDDLNTPWKFDDRPLAGTGATLSITDPAGSARTRRFYRIRALP